MDIISPQYKIDTLISEKKIKARISELGTEINSFLKTHLNY